MATRPATRLAIRRWPPWASSNPGALRLAGLGLVGLHLTLIVKVTGSPDQLALSLLFWGAVGAQVQQHWPDRLARSRPALLLGAALVGGLMLKAWHLEATETAFVRLFPLAAWAGWWLLGQGWRWLPWGPTWALVLTLSVPPRALPLLLQTVLGERIRTATAAIAAFDLHYVGFEVVHQGSFIQLPGGTVEVEFACTGAALLGLLLQVSVLLAAMAQGRGLARLAGWSVAIAALLSTVRVALMAAVVDNPAVFQFWHSASGGQIVTLVALGWLGWLGFRSPSPRGVEGGDSV